MIDELRKSPLFVGCRHEWPFEADEWILRDDVIKRSDSPTRKRHSIRLITRVSKFYVTIRTCHCSVAVCVVPKTVNRLQLSLLDHVSELAIG